MKEQTRSLSGSSLMAILLLSAVAVCCLLIRLNCVGEGMLTALLGDSYCQRSSREETVTGRAVQYVNIHCLSSICVSVVEYLI